MVAFKIEDIREMTTKLFVRETFDHFLVKEIQIVTFTRFSIDGRLRKEYFSNEELKSLESRELVSWKMLRPCCFQLIKGKRLPESFFIVLQLSGRQTEQLAASRSVNASQISGLYLNIRYEDGTLYCVTGISLSSFTLDKTLERVWDQAAEEYLKKQGIACIRQ